MQTNVMEEIQAQFQQIAAKILTTSQEKNIFLIFKPIVNLNHVKTKDVKIICTNSLLAA